MENILKQALKEELLNHIESFIPERTQEQNEYFEKITDKLADNLMNCDYFWDFVDTEIREQLEQDPLFCKLAYEE